MAVAVAAVGKRWPWPHWVVLALAAVGGLLAAVGKPWPWPWPHWVVLALAAVGGLLAAVGKPWPWPWPQVFFAFLRKICLQGEGRMRALGGGPWRHKCEPLPQN